MLCSPQEWNTYKKTLVDKDVERALELFFSKRKSKKRVKSNKHLHEYNTWVLIRGTRFVDKNIK